MDNQEATERLTQERDKSVLYVGGSGCGRRGAGGEAETTDGRMELMAALVGLEGLADNGFPATVVSVSEYLVNGMTLYLEGWERANWRKRDGKALLNADLWKRLDAEAMRRPITWERMESRVDHPESEQAHVLARKARDKVARDGWAD